MSLSRGVVGEDYMIAIAGVYEKVVSGKLGEKKKRKVSADDKDNPKVSSGEIHLPRFIRDR